MPADPNQKKVVVNCQSVANGLNLLQSKFKISGNEKFAKVIEFLRRQIHQDTVNFGIDGQLLVNYASSMAWG